MKFIDHEAQFALRARILMVAPLMVMSPSFAKPILILSFDFGFTGLELSLVEFGESTDSPILCMKCVLLIKIR